MTEAIVFLGSGILTMTVAGYILYAGVLSFMDADGDAMMILQGSVLTLAAVCTFLAGMVCAGMALDDISGYIR